MFVQYDNVGLIDSMKAKHYSSDMKKKNPDDVVTRAIL